MKIKIISIAEKNLTDRTEPTCYFVQNINNVTTNLNEPVIFSALAQSDSVDNPDKVNPTLVPNCKIRFRAGTLVKELLKSLRYAMQ